MPQMSDNFMKLCKGGEKNQKGEELTYVQSEINKIVKGGYI